MKNLSAFMIALLLGAGAAVAERPRQIEKHLAFVDLYLTNAVNSAKTLTLIGEAEPGAIDAQLIAEARRDLDTALDRAQAHMKHVRDNRAQLPAGAPAAKLQDLEGQLRDARNASKKLTALTAEGLAPGIDEVAIHLTAAEGSLRDVARTANYTLMRESSLTRVPVKGGVPAGDIERDAARPAPPPSEPVPQSAPPPSPQPKMPPPTPTPPAESPQPKVPPN